ncbi:MAG: inositol monophosphatase family protein [Candidatus Altiarchaeota archaeon]
MADETLAIALKLARKLKRTAGMFGGDYVEDVRFGATGDATYEVDEPMEAAVADFFTDARIPCRVMTEDTGVKDFGKDPRYIFLIDPLDGSRNLRRHLPLHCCSIASYGIGANELSDSVCAVVERFDAKEEFTAVRGEGVFLNGKRISSSKKTTPDDAIISLGSHFASTIPSFADYGRRLGRLTKRQERSIMVKCYGASALELAYLAAGYTDMFLDTRAGMGYKAALKTYDVAAGILLCTEAGAIVEYGSGRIPEKLPVDPYVPVMVAGAGNRELYRLLKKASPFI